MIMRRRVVIKAGSFSSNPMADRPRLALFRQLLRDINADNNNKNPCGRPGSAYQARKCE